MQKVTPRSSRPVISAITAATLASTVLVPAAQAQTGSLAGAEGAAPATAGDLASRFTLGVLPDTQFYSRYATPDSGNLYQARYGSEPYDTQTRFLVDHQDDLNIPFVTHLGDVVDQAPVTQEWDVADKAMKVLEDGGLNYSILPGNHDLGSTGNGETVFSTYFPKSRAEKNSTFVDRATFDHRESEAHIFEAEGQKYLVLAIGWRASQASIDWAQKVIDANPTLPVILTTHEMTNIDGEGNVFLSTDYGQQLFDNFVSRNDQIFLTIGGHHHGAGYVETTNQAGHKVVNILQDYQMAYQGGNGLLGLLQFDLTNNKLQMTAGSPWVAKKPAETLNQFDHLLPEGPGDSYSIDMNFTERFAGFNPEFTAGDANDPDYAQAARDILSAGYVEPHIEAGQLPTGPQDYVKTDKAAVHWRPGQMKINGQAPADGQAVPVGTVIPDVVSGQDMTRVPLANGVSVGATEDMVEFSTDHHPLSSDSGSLKWNKPDQDKNLNWFQTAADAAINKETFSDGYTFETFVKVDKEFSGDTNAWMGAVSRMGERGEISAQMPDGDEPPSTLAISSLRELQWSTVSTEGTAAAGASAWSHEVPKDEWLHVAIVNDPAKNSVVMYINDAPILRDVLDSSGLATANDPWMIGAAMWDSNPANPWFGSIGETRITHGALGKDQWLTARSHTDNGTVNLGEGSSEGSVKNGLLGTILGVLGGIGLTIVGGIAALQRFNPQLFEQLRRQLRL